jgi:YD repeat-containing protein
MRGKLTKKSVYNTAGSLLSRTEIGYTVFQEITKEIGYIAAKRIIYTGSYGPGFGQFQNPCLSPYQAYDGAEYLAVPLSQASGAKRESLITETVYAEGDPLKFVQTVTSTGFNTTYLQATSVSKTTSNTTNKVITKLKYPFSYTYNSSETGNAKALRLLKERNIINVPVEQYVLRENSGVISGQVSAFIENPANTAQIVPETIYVLESTTPATESSTYTQLVSNSLSVNALFKKRMKLSYTAQGNVKDILRIDNSANVNDIPVTYLWGYNNALPVAETKNADNTEVLTQNFEDITATTGSAHTGEQYYSGDYTVNFTKPNTRIYAVDYWYLDGTWKYIRKTYTGTSMVLNEGTAIDDVRIYPEDALITTWTHDPVYGLASGIDSNGRTAFYTYDSYGRLQLVSDTDKNVVKAYNYHYKQ